MEHLKTLHSEQPDTWTVPKLATGFGISTSAVTRILRSKFEPSAETKERQDASALKRRAERGQKLTGGKGKVIGRVQLRALVTITAWSNFLFAVFFTVLLFVRYCLPAYKR
eukprot:Em0009g793a